MMRRQHNSAGFTLIEIVVAITLMSLIMVTLAMGLRLCANAWHRGEQKLNEHARLLAGTDTLTEQISSAEPRVVTEIRRDKTPVQVVAFSGTPAEMRFCARRSWRGDRSRPLFMADYRVVMDDQGRQQLLISETGLTDDVSVLAGLEAPRAQSGEAVGDPADRIEFAYYQPATMVQPGQWVSTWTPQEGSELPRAVQIRWIHGQSVQQSTFPVAVSHNVRAR